MSISLCKASLTEATNPILLCNVGFITFVSLQFNKKIPFIVVFERFFPEALDNPSLPISSWFFHAKSEIGMSAKKPKPKQKRRKTIEVIGDV